MAETWYRTNGFGFGIESVAVTKATEKTIFFVDEYGRESRALKAAGRTRWFPTFTEARDYLVKCARSNAAGHRQNADHASNRADELEALTERRCPRAKVRWPRDGGPR